MCGDFLLEAARAKLDFDRSMIARTGAWLCKGLQWRGEGQRAACPEFSPTIGSLATNVAARTAGFLLQADAAGFAAPDPGMRDHGLRALRYVLARQLPGGSWHYGQRSLSHPPKPKVDNLHTAYVLEGLLRAAPTLHGLWRRGIRLKVQRRIHAGLTFYLRTLFPEARPIERVFVVESSKREAWLKRRPDWHHEEDQGRTIFTDPLEARSWSVGAALTSIAEAAQSGLVSLDAAGPMLDWLGRLELSAPGSPGRFAYRSDDPSLYVRHEAHIFLGLASVMDRGTSVEA
jgi:hypothetical protein